MLWLLKLSISTFLNHIKIVFLKYFFSVLKVTQRYQKNWHGTMHCGRRGGHSQEYWFQLFPFLVFLLFSCYCPHIAHIIYLELWLNSTSFWCKNHFCSLKIEGVAKYFLATNIFPMTPCSVKVSPTVQWNGCHNSVSTLNSTNIERMRHTDTLLYQHYFKSPILKYSLFPWDFETLASFCRYMLHFSFTVVAT